MSAWWQFRALIRKNLLTLKRSIFMTLMEIFYPIILMLIGHFVKKAFSSDKFTYAGEGGDSNYLIDKGNIAIDYNIYTDLAKFAYNQETNDPNVFFYKFNSDTVKYTKLTNIHSNLVLNKGVWNYITPL